MVIAAHTLTDPRPGRDRIDANNPDNKHYAEWYQSPEGVGAHELGHDFGPTHETEDNLMQGGVRHWDNSKITQKQIETIYSEYQAGRLNQDDEELAKKAKPTN